MAPSSVTPDVPSLLPASVRFPALQSSPRQPFYPESSRSFALWLGGAVGRDGERCGGTAPRWGQARCADHTGASVAGEGGKGSVWPSGTVWLTWASLVLSAPSLHDTLSFLTPGSPIRKALVECWFHSVQFRNCMLSTHHGPGLWGNKGPFLKMSQFSRKTDKDIDSYHSVWLEGSMGTTGT